MTAAQFETKRRWSWPVGLVIFGAVLAVGALVVAGIAARTALTGARVLTSSESNPLALAFAPPDYTAFWVCLTVAAVGVAVLVVGVAVTVSSRSRG